MDDDAVRDHEPDRAVGGPSALDPLPPPQPGAHPLEGPSVPRARAGDDAEAGGVAGDVVDDDVVDDELLAEEARPSPADWSASSFTRPARPVEDEPTAAVGDTDATGGTAEVATAGTGHAAIEPSEPGVAADEAGRGLTAVD